MSIKSGRWPAGVSAPSFFGIQTLRSSSGPRTSVHSVRQIAGPADGDGNMDVLFNNKRCVVVPPGVVEAVMKQIGEPIAEYERDGNLYLSTFTMSDFIRPGQNS